MNTIQQGWECPKCGRIYAPTQIMCVSCVGVVTTPTPFVAKQEERNPINQQIDLGVVPHNFEPRVGVYGAEGELCNVCGVHRALHSNI